MVDIKQLIERLQYRHNTLPHPDKRSVISEAADALERLTRPVGVEPVAELDIWDKFDELPSGTKLYVGETVARLQAENQRLIEELHAVDLGAEHMQAEKAQLQVERDELAHALDVLYDHADNFSVSGVYFHEFVENKTALQIAAEALAKIEGSKS